MKTINYNNKKVTPSKAVCIGRNYVEHIKELNNETPDTMVVFNKSNSAITNELKFFTPDTRFEGEICFLIKDKQIDAIGFGLDLTKANLQNKMKEKGWPWERAKSFDKSAVFGEFVKFSGNIEDISMKLYINDILVQYATYDLMIYKPKEMIEEINSFMTLENGDIVMSGTPKGVSSYNISDKFVGEIYCQDKLLISSTFIVNT